MIPYVLPRDWIHYDQIAVTRALAEAKAVLLALSTVPYQRRWVEKLQAIELKREVAGTSRIEGAEFTERELDAAIREDAEPLHTRSQRQAHAAVRTYRWIAKLPDDMPVDSDLIKSTHRSIVDDADDDHCPPGETRARDQNVTFGTPRHRGCDGGEACEEAFARLTKAIQHEYRGHDPLIQALGAHYHLAAMHPFLDGNGRTARALEALMLQRAGLRETSFIAMSNFYYEEKSRYLAALADVRQREHDLTTFLLFGLEGVASQGRRVLFEIQHNIAKALFRGFAMELYNRLESPRKRPLAQRQLAILERLLEEGPVDAARFVRAIAPSYRTLKAPWKALARDLDHLIELEAIELSETDPATLSVRLDWPSRISETQFFERVTRRPGSKSFPFLR
jgi:Fic family protein